MTNEQKTTYINKQTALLNATIAGMQAENTYRQHRGETIAYTEDAFIKAVDESGCHSDTCLTLFHDLEDKVSELENQLEQYRKAFEHYHVNDPNSNDDICKQCNLDLRNEIHTGVTRL